MFSAPWLLTAQIQFRRACDGVFPFHPQLAPQQAVAETLNIV